MMRIEWRDAWINTLIDAGYDSNTAKNIYNSIYGETGPDLTIKAAQAAKKVVVKLNAEKISGK